ACPGAPFIPIPVTRARTIRRLPGDSWKTVRTTDPLTTGVLMAARTDAEADLGRTGGARTIPSRTGDTRRERAFPSDPTGPGSSTRGSPRLSLPSQLHRGSRSPPELPPTPSPER